jgi:hypothetical protein
VARPGPAQPGPARPMGHFFLIGNPWAGPGQLFFSMDIHHKIFEQNMKFLKDVAYFQDVFFRKICLTSFIGLSIPAMKTE